MLFRMVPKRDFCDLARYRVLELCCFEWFQNERETYEVDNRVLELCCFEWFQNDDLVWYDALKVLELCCFEWFQNFNVLR